MTEAERQWFTVAEVAERLHVEHRTAWKYVRLYRDRCHYGRNGPHPRRVLWVPSTVVAQIERQRRGGDFAIA